MRYEVEADWNLLTTCNFRCSYCFFPHADLGAKISVYGTSAQWKEGFDSTGKTWLLHMTGGEPTIYPGFVDLCAQLSDKHYLSINSNLSHSSIEAFAEDINPERVHFINASVHWKERREWASHDAFIKRVHKLRKYRFNVLVSLVMTPEIVSTFDEVSRHFESQGLFVIPKIIRGNYNGKNYPAAYSANQKHSILEYLIRARKKYVGVIDRMGEPATINMFGDSLFINGFSNYRGKVCGSGYNFVMIRPDGSVIRCASEENLGNILLKNIKFLHSPKPCNTSGCPYFCEKYTSPQFAGANQSNNRVLTIQRVLGNVWNNQ